MSDSSGTWPWAVGTSLAGRYLLDALVREDPGAALYRATDTAEQRIVSLEGLRDLRVDLRGSGRFEQALAALRALDHPNIASILDHGVYQRRRFMVLDWFEGESLQVRLARGPLSVDAALGIIRQLLAALASLHAVSLVHGNLTPYAVFLQRLRHGLERVKLVQFRFAGAASAAEHPYRAPELAKAEPPTARSDVFAVGAMLQEMLAGATARKKAADALAVVLETQASAAEPELDPAMRVLLIRATAADPSQRFVDAAEMLCALIDALPRVLSVQAPEEAAADAPSTPLETVAGPVVVQDLEQPVAHALEVQSLAPVEGPLTAPSSASRQPVTPQLLAAGAGMVVVSLLGAYALFTTAQRPAAQSTPVLTPLVAQPLPAASAVRPTQGAAHTEISAVTGHSAPESRTAHAVPSPALVARARAGAPPARNPWLDAVPDGLQGLPAYVANGGQGDESMVRSLRDYSRINAADPRGYLLLGRLYCNRLWRSDCVASWALALKRDPSVRGAPELLPALIQLVLQGKDAAAAGTLIADTYGQEALAAIEDAMAPLKATEAAERLRTLHARILADNPG